MLRRFFSQSLNNNNNNNRMLTKYLCGLHYPTLSSPYRIITKRSHSSSSSPPSSSSPSSPSSSSSSSSSSPVSSNIFQRRNSSELALRPDRGPRNMKSFVVQQKEADPSQYICLNNLTKTLPDGRILFQNLNLVMKKGARIGILGINGTGKTSFLKIVSGIDADYDGEKTICRGVKIGFLPQEPQLDDTKTVLENIHDGVRDKLALLKKYEQTCEETQNGQGIAENELIQKVQKLNIKDLPHKIEKAMTALRCPPGHMPVSTLSGGEKRRVALCRLLISQPDVLLLDEPTNHLDAQSVSWLEKFLHDYQGTVMTVTHDRYFLNNIISCVLEIDQGKAHKFEGNYSQWLAYKEKLLQSEQKEKIREKNIREEREWISKPLSARHAKTAARITSFGELYENARTTRPSPGTIYIPTAPRLGHKVIDIRNISKSFNGKVLFKDFSFKLNPGAIVGVIGPNGCGKTTLVNILTNSERPDSGQVEIGPTVQLGFVSQTRETLNPKNTIFEEISQGSTTIPIGNSQCIDIHQYIAGFNFNGDVKSRRISVLSGGERNRVHLAKMIKSAPNVLLLDEPTNDLDVEVLRSLEASLHSFAGSAIVVSHDRWFLDRICTHIIAFEPDGELIAFSGNYSQYKKDFEKRKPTNTKERHAKFGFM